MGGSCSRNQARTHGVGQAEQQASLQRPEALSAGNLHPSLFIFWDLENVPLPSNKPAVDVISHLKAELEQTSGGLQLSKVVMCLTERSLAQIERGEPNFLDNIANMRNVPIQVLLAGDRKKKDVDVILMKEMLVVMDTMPHVKLVLMTADADYINVIESACRKCMLHALVYLSQSIGLDLKRKTEHVRYLDWERFLRDKWGPELVLPYQDNADGDNDNHPQNNRSPSPQRQGAGGARQFQQPTPPPRDRPSYRSPSPRRRQRRGAGGARQFQQPTPPPGDRPPYRSPSPRRRQRR